MNVSPKWITKEQALYTHEQSLSRHGGGAGVRDQALLVSALMKPKNMHTYGERDIFQLASGYAWGIARNHPFVDGNKRTAYTVAAIFVHVAGFKLTIPNVSKQIAQFEMVAAGNVSQDCLADFYKSIAIRDLG